MTKEAIIKKTLTTLQSLPLQKAEEVSHYADYILKMYEEDALQKGVEKIMSESETFNFLLNEEEELYSLKDIKEKF